MKKIRLCTHRSVSTDVLRAVQKLGSVEFVDITGKDPSLTQKEKKRTMKPLKLLVSWLGVTITTSHLLKPVQRPKRLLKKRVKILPLLQPKNSQLRSILTGSVIKKL